DYFSSRGASDPVRCKGNLLRMLRFALIALVTGQVLLAAEPVVVAAPDEQEAARELVRYVAKATGKELHIEQQTFGASPRILVGAGVCPPELRSRIDGDGYLIESLPDGSLVLAGGGRDGTSFAVYRFLERALGIRWLWPGESGEVVPRSSSLTLTGF